ncbi:unnamed protein product [Calicophoron daubneyi]
MAKTLNSRAVMGDEAEEGEVKDSSDPEDPDSDNSVGGHSCAPKQNISTFRSASGPGSELKRAPGFSDLSQIPLPKLPRTESFLPSEDTVHEFRDLEKMQLQMQLADVNFTEVKTEDKSCGTETLASENFRMHGGFLAAMPALMTSGANNQVGMHIRSSAPGAPIPGLWTPAAPPSSASGSRQEIEQMHHLYQKACELYERAMARVTSSGVNLSLGIPPKPPPAPLQPVTRNASQFSAITENSSIPLMTVADPPKSASGLAAGLTHPPKSGSEVACAAAYRLAYRQTLKIMSSMANPPAPNTPEYMRQWKHYMDHYLHYYLQVDAFLIPSRSPSIPAPDIPPVPSVTTTQIQSSNPKSTSVAATSSNLDKIATPKPDKEVCETPPLAGSAPSPAPIQVTSDIPLPSTSPPAVNNNDRTRINSGQQDSEQEEEPGESKPTSSSSSNESASSKYIWISNLPQGIKAIDIKERCAPFGRAQTIKIIGSRKSKPPSIYAYLIMETADAAARLVEGLQGGKFENNEIKIKRINALPIP